MTNQDDVAAASALRAARDAADADGVRAAVARLVEPLIPWVLARTRPADDRRSAGLFGLVLAAHRYDPTFGPFDRFAKATASKEIAAADVAATPLPLTARAREDYRTVLNTAESSNVDLDTADVRRLAKLCDIPVPRVLAAVAIAQGPVPIATTGDIADAADRAVTADQRELVQALLNTLDAADAWLIRARFGIGRAAPMTREEAARFDPHGRTINQIRYAEQQALDVLRQRAVDLGPALLDALHPTPALSSR